MSTEWLRIEEHSRTGNLRTFFHQKRFRNRENEESSDYPGASKTDGKPPDPIIDHRQIEDHRLKWEKQADWILYLLAAALILYGLFA